MIHVEIFQRERAERILLDRVRRAISAPSITPGSNTALYAFVMTLGFSRVMYLDHRLLGYRLVVALPPARVCLLRWVPREVLHDNLKSAVLGRDAAEAIHWNPRYLDFATHWGFRPRACAPYRAQTKGKVENGVGYVRKNFWPGLTFHDLAELNMAARTWLDSVANQRRHGTTGIVPFSRLAAEQLVALRPGAPTIPACWLRAAAAAIAWSVTTVTSIRCPRPRPGRTYCCGPPRAMN